LSERHQDWHHRERQCRRDVRDEMVPQRSSGHVRQALSDACDVSGKIMIDATNPLLPDLSGLAVPASTSGAEMVAQWAKGAKVVKAFNTVGANVMADPTFKEGPVIMFYCGDDTSAKQVVSGLVQELGFGALDAGPLRQARVRAVRSAVDLARASVWLRA